MKPSDVFVNAIDFFPTLVPGAIATFFLMTPIPPQVLCQWPHLRRESAEFWVVFFVIAYVLGHVIAAVGSVVLDRIYDRLYVRWRRATSEFARKNLPEEGSRWRVLGARLKHVIDKSNPSLQQRILREISSARLPPRLSSSQKTSPTRFGGRVPSLE